MRNNYVNPLGISSMQIQLSNEGKQFGSIWTKVFVLGFLAVLLTISQTFAQERTITGKVIDASGVGVPGASVYLKGTTRGTTTDAEGKYSIAVTEGATLVLQSLGYATQEFVIAGQTNIDATLAEDAQKLNEIVVVGYGTQERKDVTGSVAKIGSEDFNPGPITNPLQQINGKAAGVNINQVGSEPGVTPNIRIRGITSLIGGNDPLVVVDGIQGDLSLLNQIPPSEIVSIDILKDASATAIYGSRGAAGVVLVTTKKGGDDQSTIEYNGVFSVETIAKKFDVLGADAYRQAATDRGLSGFDRGGNTDWLDEITQTGYTQNHTLSFGGGSKAFSYRASGTAILQDGLIINSGLQNYIGRVQATQRGLDDKLTLNYNLNIGTFIRKFNGPGSVGTAIATRPTNPVFNENGTYFYDQTLFAYTNPVARVKEIIDGDNTNNLFGSIRADYELIEGLTASVFGSWRRTDRTYEGYQSRLATYDGQSNNGIGVRETNRSNERLLDVILNYKKSFGKHNLDIIGVYEWQKGIFEGNRIRGINFPNDDLGVSAIQNAGTFQQGDVSSYKNDRTVISFLGRVNYTFNEKYILTASFRRDGSSVFGKNNKWANFPAVSVAWRLSQEEFIKGISLISDLKLRAGFGITGNQQGLGPLNSVLLAGNNGNTFFGGQVIRNFSIQQNANPNLKWETRQMYNFGLDFGLLEGKLSGTFDFFYGTTTDLLFDYQVPVPPYPFGTIKANIGEVLNQGFEATLNYKLFDTKDLTVNLMGNFSANKTRVENLSGSLDAETALATNFVGWGGVDLIGVGGQNNDMSYLIQGQALGTFYLFKHAGIDDNGNQLVDDVNGNGQIDQGRLSGDRYIAGQALPKFTYAFTPSARYKNWDFSLVFRGAYGHKIYNARRAQLSILNRLGQSNVLADAVGVGLVNLNEAAATDFWLEDGGFSRLENFTVAYNFKTINWKAIKSMRLSFTTNNLFVITQYKGIDPEIQNNGGSGAGIDTGIYPRSRNFAIGLNLMLK